jgi:hypothetical protein
MYLDFAQVNTNLYTLLWLCFQYANN